MTVLLGAITAIVPSAASVLCVYVRTVVLALLLGPRV